MIDKQELRRKAEARKAEGFDLLHNISCDGVLSLLAELEACKADADRYRWLCNGNGYYMEEAGLCGHYNEKEEADQRIDAAIAMDSKDG